MITHTATLTSKGQITIPKEVREYYHLQVGSKLDFVIEADGSLRIIPRTLHVEDLFGMLHRPGMKPVSLEEMDDAVMAGASDIHDWA